MFVNERAIRKRIDIIKEQLNTLGKLTDITQTDTGFYLVHILTTGTTASECIPGNTCCFYIHLDTVVYQRSHKYGSKRSLP